VAQGANGIEAVDLIEEHHPDVVFLDVQMPGLDGFAVIKRLMDRHGAKPGKDAEPLPQVVFATAYDQYAVRAFDVNAVDYLLKPYDRERFLRSIDRVKTALADPDHGDLEERVRRVLSAMPGQPAPIKQILIRDRARAYFIPVDSIDRISAAGNYVEIHAGGKVHLMREPLAKLTAQLDAGEFIRVHRSHVVRLSFIAELQPMFHGDYELVLRNGERLALSRRYKALLPPAIRERL